MDETLHVALSSPVVLLTPHAVTRLAAAVSACVPAQTPPPPPRPASSGAKVTVSAGPLWLCLSDGDGGLMLLMRMCGANVTNFEAAALQAEDEGGWMVSWSEFAVWVLAAPGVVSPPLTFPPSPPVFAREVRRSWLESLYHVHTPDASPAWLSAPPLLRLWSQQPPATAPQPQLGTCCLRVSPRGVVVEVSAAHARFFEGADWVQTSVPANLEDRADEHRPRAVKMRCGLKLCGVQDLAEISECTKFQVITHPQSRHMTRRRYVRKGRDTKHSSFIKELTLTTYRDN